MADNDTKELILDRLHEAVSVCAECGQNKCSHSSGTILPQTIDAQVVLRAINYGEFFFKEKVATLVIPSDNPPYICTEHVVVNKVHNPNYGEDRTCKCGHDYYRHFDTYADMEAVGCKYCQCWEFIEASPEEIERMKDDD
jgi:hypothetical protein